MGAVLCAAENHYSILCTIFFWYSLLHQYTHALRNVNQLVS